MPTRLKSIGNRKHHDEYVSACPPTSIKESGPRAQRKGSAVVLAVATHRNPLDWIVRSNRVRHQHNLDGSSNCEWTSSRMYWLRAVSGASLASSRTGRLLRYETQPSSLRIDHREAVSEIRSLKAAIRHRVLPTHSGLMMKSWSMSAIEDVSFSGDFPPGSAPPPAAAAWRMPSATRHVAPRRIRSR